MQAYWSHLYLSPFRSGICMYEGTESVPNTFFPLIFLNLLLAETLLTTNAYEIGPSCVVPSRSLIYIFLLLTIAYIQAKCEPNEILIKKKIQNYLFLSSVT